MNCPVRAVHTVQHVKPKKDPFIPGKTHRGICRAWGTKAQSKLRQKLHGDRMQAITHTRNLIDSPPWRGSMHHMRERVNPIFSTVLSQNSKLLVIAQLHPRSTEHLMSNIHLHNTIQHAFLMQVQAPHLCIAILKLHILHTPTTTTTTGSSLLFHWKQTGLHHVSFWLRT